MLLLQGNWPLEAELPQVSGRQEGANVNKGIYDIHVIAMYLTNSRCSAWVFDIGLVAHICNSKQELRNKRRMEKDQMTMRMGNMVPRLM